MSKITYKKRANQYSSNGPELNPSSLLTGHLTLSPEAEFSNSHRNNNAHTINKLLRCSMVPCAQYLVLRRWCPMYYYHYMNKYKIEIL